MKTLGALLALTVAIPLHGSISGLVVTSDGTPLANVRVAAFRPVPQMLSLAEYTRDHQPASLATAVTDAKGTFALDVAGSGLVDLHAAAEGFAPADVVTTTDEPAQTIALSRAAIVSGQVTANGKPVANAFVLAVPQRGLPFFATTDAQGRYRMPDPKTWARMIIVRHPDFMPAAHQPASLDFSLEPGQTIKGKVVDANGRPVEGALVDIDQIVSATSAADGTFTIAHVARPASTMRARATAGTAQMAFTAGTPVLRLAPAARLSGVVRDASKRPLGGIAIAAWSQQGSGATITDARGAFELSGLPRGAYQLVGDGAPFYSIDNTAIDATAGDAKQDLVAKSLSAIEGIVRDAEGKPVAGAAISLLYDRGALVIDRSDRSSISGLMLMPTPVVTGPDGRFRLQSGVGPETRVRVAALKPAMPPAISEVVQGRTPVTIVIPHGIALKGTVVDADKKPLAGVRIEPMIGMNAPDMSVESQSVAWATTDQEGHFHAELTAATQALTLAKQGYIGAQQVVAMVAGMAPLQVVLTKGMAIRGHVVNKDGSPAADVSVGIMSAKFAMSGADGSFAIEELPAGPVELHFGRGVAGLQSQVVAAPSDDVKLVLNATRSIHGRVIDAATGTAVEKFMVEAVRKSDELQIPQPVQSPAGEFTIDIPEGDVTLNVTAEGFAPSRNVPVAAGNGDAVSIKLSRGRTLRGLVVDEKGQPLAAVSVTVEALQQQSSELEAPETRDDGSFEVRGLPFDDETRVGFAKKDYVTTERKLTTGHDDITLNVTLRRGVTLTGHVVDRAGAAVSGVSVEASSAAHGAESASAETGVSGAFQFDGLAPARYDFTTERQETAERGSAKDIDVEKIHDLTIRLEAHPTGTIVGRVSGNDSSQMMPTSVSASNVEGDSASARTDPAGNYRMEGAPVGIVTVQATSYGRGSARTRSSAKTTVDVQPGTEARADLVFATQVPLRGHVTRGGAPLGGVTIRFDGSNEQIVLATPEGAYETTLDPGEYDVTLAAGQTALPFAQHITVQQASEIDLRVEGATITATVLDAESGAPVVDATVTLAPRGQTHTTGTGTTAADGTASLDVPLGADVTVVATKRGYANASDDLTASGNATVVLHLARTPGAVIRVVDVRDGRTLSGYVIARGEGAGVVASATETDPDGTVTLPLAAGGYRISASAEGYGSHTIAASVPAGEIRVPLPRGGSLAIRSNTDVRGSARLIQPDGEEYVRCWCNGIAEIKLEGRMTLVDRVAPGSYVLEVTLAGGKPRRFPVSVVEGRTMTANID